MPLSGMGRHASERLYGRWRSWAAMRVQGYVQPAGQASMMTLSWLLLLVLSASWPTSVSAMRSDRIVELRHEAVNMFYHGYNNYMRVAFPEDEVRTDYM